MTDKIDLSLLSFMCSVINGTGSVPRNYITGLGESIFLSKRTSNNIKHTGWLSITVFILFTNLNQCCCFHITFFYIPYSKLKNWTGPASICWQAFYFRLFHAFKLCHPCKTCLPFIHLCWFILAKISLTWLNSTSL